MVKIYVNGTEIETERHADEDLCPTIKDLDEVMELLDSKSNIPVEFEDFFVKNGQDFL